LPSATLLTFPVSLLSLSLNPSFSLCSTATSCVRLSFLASSLLARERRSRLSFSNIDSRRLIPSSWLLTPSSALSLSSLRTRKSSAFVVSTWFLPRPQVWIVYLASGCSGAPPGQMGVQNHLQIPVALRPTVGCPQFVLDLKDSGRPSALCRRLCAFPVAHIAKSANLAIGLLLGARYLQLVRYTYRRVLVLLDTGPTLLNTIGLRALEVPVQAKGTASGLVLLAELGHASPVLSLAQIAAWLALFACPRTSSAMDTIKEPSHIQSDEDGHSSSLQPPVIHHRSITTHGRTGAAIEQPDDETPAKRQINHMQARFCFSHTVHRGLRSSPTCLWRAFRGGAGRFMRVAGPGLGRGEFCADISFAGLDTGKKKRTRTGTRRISNVDIRERRFFGRGDASPLTQLGKRKAVLSLDEARGRSDSLTLPSDDRAQFLLEDVTMEGRDYDGKQHQYAGARQRK
ncbi:hypothetical protein KCU83_g160, partial [Aureobasidium melanogenum]